MTIAEVAKQAGVSAATCYRVINHHPYVSDLTAKNVRRAMRDVGYSPARTSARPRYVSRSSPRRANIHLFAFCPESWGKEVAGFQRLAAGASSVLRAEDAGLTIQFVSDVEEAKALGEANHSIDGILACGGHVDGASELLADVPVVWLMSNMATRVRGDQVMSDSAGVCRIASKYLVDQGCDQLAFLSLLPGYPAFRQRAVDFASAAESLGVNAEVVELSPLPDWHHRVDLDPSESATLKEASDHLVDNLLKIRPRINGVFVASDAQAALLVPALQRRGVNTALGGDIPVISCDNERPYLMGLDPCPATIDLRVDSIGAFGAEKLLWRIAKDVPIARTCTTIEPGLVLPGERKASEYAGDLI